jgi:hypothetical protein
MAETRIQDQDFYTGIIPTVFKKVDQSDVRINPFQTNKFWSVVSGSDTGSALPLIAIYSDVNNLPALGSELTFNDATNIDGTLQTLTYFSINHQFYKYKKNPSQTFGPTDLNRTKKYLYQSASILSFPQIRVGEGIKPTSFRLTGSYSVSVGSVYGTSTYGTASYGSVTPLYIHSDRYGNLYDTSFNTASIVTRSLMYYEGFNEYFDASRIEYISSGVTYQPGVKTLTGTTQSIGLLAQFDGNGYIKTNIDGYYDRNHDYAISFWIRASNTGSSNNLVMAKASSSITPQYPFKIEVDTFNQLVFTIAGSTTFKSELTSTVTVDGGDHVHVICQKTGSIMEIWLDGYQDIITTNNLLIDTQSPFTASARIDNTSPLFIGGFESGSNLTGTIDEIRIFNRALTATEIGYLADRSEGGTFMQTNHVGNVFGKQGVVVISTPDYRYHDIINQPYSASYRSTKTIYEMGVTVEIGSGDFNATLNRSATADDDKTYQSYVTASSFAPYITTIGLYDDAGRLLAIGKLAQPIRKRPDVDMNFLIRVDLDRNIS